MVSSLRDVVLNPSKYPLLPGNLTSYRRPDGSYDLSKAAADVAAGRADAGNKPVYSSGGGSSGSSGGGSSGGNQAPKMYAVSQPTLTPLQALKLEAQTGQTYQPKFNTSPEGVLARNRWFQEKQKEIEKMNAPTPQAVVSKFDVEQRELNIKSKQTEQFAKDLQTKAKQLEEESKSLDLYNEQAVNAFNTRVQQLNNDVKVYESQAGELQQTASRLNQQAKTIKLVEQVSPIQAIVRQKTFPKFVNLGEFDTKKTVPFVVQGKKLDLVEPVRQFGQGAYEFFDEPRKEGVTRLNKIKTGNPIIDFPLALGTGGLVVGEGLVNTFTHPSETLSFIANEPGRFAGGMAVGFAFGGTKGVRTGIKSGVVRLAERVSGVKEINLKRITTQASYDSLLMTGKGSPVVGKPKLIKQQATSGATSKALRETFFEATGKKIPKDMQTFTKGISLDPETFIGRLGKKPQVVEPESLFYEPLGSYYGVDVSTFMFGKPTVKYSLFKSVGANANKPVIDVLVSKSRQPKITPLKGQKLVEFIRSKELELGFDVSKLGSKAVEFQKAALLGGSRPPILGPSLKGRSTYRDLFGTEAVSKAISKPTKRLGVVEPSPMVQAGLTSEVDVLVKAFTAQKRIDVSKGLGKKLLGYGTKVRIDLPKGGKQFVPLKFFEFEPNVIVSPKQVSKAVSKSLSRGYDYYSPGVEVRPLAAKAFRYPGVISKENYSFFDFGKQGVSGVKRVGGRLSVSEPKRINKVSYEKYVNQSVSGLRGLYSGEQVARPSGAKQVKYSTVEYERYVARQFTPQRYTPKQYKLPQYTPPRYTPPRVPYFPRVPPKTPPRKRYDSVSKGYDRWVKGFIPVSKVRGKFIPLSRRALSFYDATKLGRKFTETTTARTFGLKEYGRVLESNFRPVDLSKYRRRLPNSKLPFDVFIEKNIATINTLGEKEQLKQARNKKKGGFFF